MQTHRVHLEIQNSKTPHLISMLKSQGSHFHLQMYIHSLYMCVMFLCVHTSENIYMQHTISLQLATNSSQIARNIIVILPTQHLLATCKYKKGKFVHLSVTGSKVMNNLTQQRPDLPDGL